MAESTSSEGGQDKQKQYLIEKFGGLLGQIGEGYGGPLQQELIRRLEKTVADFHEEVSGLLDDLKLKSEKRHEELKRLWENKPETQQPESNPVEQAVPEEPAEMSDWERRLEEKSNQTKTAKSKTSPVTKEPEKKRGFFRKKSKD